MYFNNGRESVMVNYLHCCAGYVALSGQVWYLVRLVAGILGWWVCMKNIQIAIGEIMLFLDRRRYCEPYCVRSVSRRNKKGLQLLVGL